MLVLFFKLAETALIVVFDVDLNLNMSLNFWILIEYMRSVTGTCVSSIWRSRYAWSRVDAADNLEIALMITRSRSFSSRILATCILV